jgi:hypothetical protein
MSMPAYEAKKMNEAYQLRSQLIAKGDWCNGCDRVKPLCVCGGRVSIIKVDAHLGGVRA